MCVNQIFWVVFLLLFFFLPVPITKDWLILLLLILFNPWNLIVRVLLSPAVLAPHAPLPVPVGALLSFATLTS
jgi:hypothetical protein